MGYATSRAPWRVGPMGKFPTDGRIKILTGLFRTLQLSRDTTESRAQEAAV
jgi:hypothetical protein